MRQSLAALTADLTEVAGRDGPMAAAMRAALADATGQAAARVERALAGSAEQVRAALSPADPAGPLAVVRHDIARTAEEVRRDLAGLRELLVAAREHAAVMTRTAVAAAVEGAYADLSAFDLTDRQLASARRSIEESARVTARLRASLHERLTRALALLGRGSGP